MNNRVAVRLCFRAVLLVLALLELVFPIAPANIHADDTPGDGLLPLSAAPSVPAPIVSDSFNSCELDGAVWDTYNQWGNQYAIEGAYSGQAQLKITVPAGEAHTISGTNTRAARAMQSVPNNGDFEVVAKFTSVPVSKYQMQGILVQGSLPNEFLRFEFYSDGSELHFFAATLSTYGDLSTKTKDAIRTPGIGEDLYVRVQRRDDRWIYYYSYNGVTWLPQGSIPYTFKRAVTVVGVGVYAGNSNSGGAAPKYEALADYFFDYNTPIGGEDAGRADIRFTLVGDGMVTKDPDKLNYLCGEQVRLHAEPTGSSGFVGWSGDFLPGESQTAPTTDIVMRGPRRITATFSSQEMNLTVNVVGSGQVKRDPPPPAKLYFGQQVTLEAVPAAGNRFQQWSGGLSGAQNPISFNITQDMNVTATFVEGTYALTVDPGTHGTVDIQPLKAGGYNYGDVVVLTLTPQLGWMFTGWSGASAADPVDQGDGTWRLTINEDEVLAATWSEAEYTLEVRVVEGAGSVERLPNKSSYRYGETVQLTARPHIGFEFAGWGGDASGNDNPLLITITDDVMINVHFVPGAVRYYFLPFVVVKR